MLYNVFCESTDQYEGVAIDAPDQTGLFAIPLLCVHQLPILYFHKGLQNADKQKSLLHPSVQNHIIMFGALKITISIYICMYICMYIYILASILCKY